MEVKSEKATTNGNTTLFFITILVASHFSPVTPTNTWVGSKYQIQCTMCAACDNPCNQQPPPPPPPTSGTGGGYYYSPPPPTSGTGGGFYYSPPPPSQGGSVYPPPSYGNYPNPEPPNPIMNNFPYYYHGSPVVNSAFGVPLSAAVLLISILSSYFFLNM